MVMKEPMIAIIDYRAGNLASVERAVRHLGFPCRVTSSAGEINDADRIIFPGVGAAGKAMANLSGLGLDKVIKEQVEIGKPVLGICLGAQIILSRSQENEATCLGLIKGQVVQFPQPDMSAASVTNERLKVPHMGWNGIKVQRPHPLLDGILPDDEFYFVHGYYPLPASESVVLATTEYGIEFACVIGQLSLVAVQFHPEKSGPAGLKLLKNFCEWEPRNAQ